MNASKRIYNIPVIFILTLTALSGCQSITAAQDNTNELDTPPMEVVSTTSKPSHDIIIDIPDEPVFNNKPDIPVSNVDYYLDYYTDFLRDRINNRFIRFEYCTKDDLNLTLVFYECFLLKAPWGDYYYVENISDIERSELLEYLSIDGNDYIEDITRCYVPEAIDFIRYMTGYEFSREELGAALNIDGYQWTYLEDRDAYYLICGDTEYRFVTCDEVVELNDGQKNIYYVDEAGQRAVLTIEEIDGRIVFISNRYL
ncbi:MAG: hypothetical protein FWE83_02940 [Oscillospiraceae bacterium]|nr:hypothetical protein [Oscillospiraceae bacterium]